MIFSMSQNIVVYRLDNYHSAHLTIMRYPCTTRCAASCWCQQLLNVLPLFNYRETLFTIIVAHFTVTATIVWHSSIFSLQICQYARRCWQNELCGTASVVFLAQENDFDFGDLSGLLDSNFTATSTTSSNATEQTPLFFTEETQQQSMYGDDVGSGVDVEEASGDGLLITSDGVTQTVTTADEEAETTMVYNVTTSLLQTTTITTRTTTELPTLTTEEPVSQDPGKQLNQRTFLFSIDKNLKQREIYVCTLMTQKLTKRANRYIVMTIGRDRRMEPL